MVRKFGDGKKYKMIERCQDKYIKQTLELNTKGNTKSHNQREKRLALRIESGKRALKFEEKIRDKSNT